MIPGSCTEMVVEDALRYYEGMVISSGPWYSEQYLRVVFKNKKSQIALCFRYPQWWCYTAERGLWSSGVKGQCCWCIQLSAMGAPRSHPDSRWHRWTCCGYVMILIYVYSNMGWVSVCICSANYMTCFPIDTCFSQGLPQTVVITVSMLSPSKLQTHIQRRVVSFALQLWWGFPASACLLLKTRSLWPQSQSLNKYVLDHYIPFPFMVSLVHDDTSPQLWLHWEAAVVSKGDAAKGIHCCC